MSYSDVLTAHQALTWRTVSCGQQTDLDNFCFSFSWTTSPHCRSPSSNDALYSFI